MNTGCLTSNLIYFFLTHVATNKNKTVIIYKSLYPLKITPIFLNNSYNLFTGVFIIPIYTWRNQESIRVKHVPSRAHGYPASARCSQDSCPGVRTCRALTPSHYPMLPTTLKSQPSCLTTTRYAPRSTDHRASEGW